MSDKHVLPDVLQGDLKVVICGTAAGKRSGQLGEYYAGKNNKFWGTLHAIDLTPRLLQPREFSLLPQYGIGLTDVSKTYSGADKGLRSAHFDPAALRRWIADNNLRALAFNGKKAAGVFYKLNDTTRLAYGQPPEKIGTTTVFVLPSTSGAAGGFWDIHYWQQLAAFLK
jgi:TDG/mug DNA glycosylase family protein